MTSYSSKLNDSLTSIVTNENNNIIFESTYNSMNKRLSFEETSKSNISEKNYKKEKNK